MTQRRDPGGYAPGYQQHPSMGRYTQDPLQQHGIQSLPPQYLDNNMDHSNLQAEVGTQGTNEPENLSSPNKFVETAGFGAWSDGQCDTQQQQWQQDPDLVFTPQNLPVEQTLDPRLLSRNPTTGYNAYQAGQLANANRHQRRETRHAPLYYFSRSQPNNLSPLYRHNNPQLLYSVPFGAASTAPPQHGAYRSFSQHQASNTTQSNQGYSDNSISHTGGGNSTTPSSVNLSDNSMGWARFDSNSYPFGQPLPQQSFSGAGPPMFDQERVPPEDEIQETDRLSSTTESSVVSGVCQACGQQFHGRHGKGNLTRHWNSLHGGRDKLKCDFPGCGRMFRRSDAKGKHFRARHQSA